MEREREFTYNKKSWCCTDADILKLCGPAAERLVRCRKDRRGFWVVYQLKAGKHDSRDSGQATAFVSYHTILVRNNQVV